MPILRSVPRPWDFRTVTTYSLRIRAIPFGAEGGCGFYKTAEDFSGKKVVAQNASLQQSLVTEQLPSDIQFQPVTAITDGVLMLTTGKADALAVSYDNGEMLMKSYPEIAMTGFKFDHSDEGNVIAVKKGEDELLEAVNGIIAEVNESGLYSQWTEEARALAESLGIEMK